METLPSKKKQEKKIINNLLQRKTYTVLQSLTIMLQAKIRLNIHGNDSKAPEVKIVIRSKKIIYF